SCPFLDPSPGPNQARSANPSSHHRLRYHLEQRGAEFGCSVAGAPAPIAAAGFLASAKPTPSGGFSVAFEKIGLNEKRAKYDRDNRTIYINLEHPRVAVEVSNSKSRSPHWRYLWLCWWSWLDVPPAALALKSVELRRPSA